MKIFNKQTGIGMVLAIGMLVCGVASATVVMRFNTFASGGEDVGNYYNGGCSVSYNGGPSHCNGPSDGVSWTAGAIAGGAPGGIYNTTANEPSPNGVMGFLGNDTNAFMNVASGFSTGFSFWYSAPFVGGTIIVYDGLNGAGNVLATVNLSSTGISCPEFVTNVWASCWTSLAVAFSGTAQSVSFNGTSGQIVFDDIELGSDQVYVPEPAALGMFGLGLLLLGGFVTLRRRQALKA